jgi:hypothetical protein
VTPSDIALIEATLDRRLEKMSLRTVRKPEHTTALGLNESKLEAVLNDCVSYKSEAQARYDVDSVSAIFRLRKAQRFVKLEKCRALFVTVNHAVIAGTAQFFASEYRYGADDVPICLHADTLGTLAWLKDPTSAPDLPGKRILADCYAALNPDTGTWQRFVDEVEKLRSAGSLDENDYLLLRSSMEARQAVMEITKGNAGAFSTGTVEEVLRQARAAVTREAEAALELAREGASRDGERIAELQARLSAAEAEREETTAAQKRWVERLAGLTAKYLWLCIRTLLVAAIFVAAYASAFRPEGWAKWVATAIILGVSTAFNWGCAPVRTWGSKWERRLALRIALLLRRVYGESQVSGGGTGPLDQ